MRLTAAALLALLPTLAGCGGSEGQLELDVVSPTGSSPFVGLARVRLSVLREGAAVLQSEGAVGAAGEVELDLSLPATGVAGDVRLEGLDAAGTVRVRGRLPPLELFASTGVLKIWVAPLGTAARLPVSLPVAVAAPAVVPLPFGALLAGGAGEGGHPVTNVVVWNQFFLDLQAGLPLPAARRDLTGVGGDIRGGIFLFGGADDSGAPQGDLWRFDTTVPPSGAYTSITVPEPMRAARFGARAQQVGEVALITGGSTAAGAAEGSLLVALPDSVALAPSVTALPGSPRGAAPALAATGGGILIAGSGPAERFTLAPSPAFAAVTAPAALAALSCGSAALPDGRVVLTSCGNAAIYLFDPATSTITEQFATLATARSGASVTAVGGEILIAGGRDLAGLPLGDAEVLDAATIARARVITLSEPRTAHAAVLLRNGTVLLAGGLTSGDRPTATLELYTPDKL